MSDRSPRPDHAGQHDLAEYRDVVRSFRDAALTAAELVEGSDSAGEALTDLTRLAARSEVLLARLVEKHGGSGRPVPVESERTLAEARELLEESITRLQTAGECARLSMLRLGAQLEDSIQGEKGARAY